MRNPANDYVGYGAPPYGYADPSQQGQVPPGGPQQPPQGGRGY